MTYREYNNSHFGSMIQLIKRAWDERAVYDAVDYSLIDPFWYQDNVFNNPEYILLVAEDGNGDAQGFILGRIQDDAIKIVMLLVDRAFRNRNFGQTLKTILTAKARAMGKSKIYAVNRYDNIHSLNLNNKLGWTVTGITDDYYRAELVFAHKTIEEWCKIKGFRIIDPDGFDRTDPYLYSRRFSEEEFDTRSVRSTVQYIKHIPQNADELEESND